MLLGFGYLHNFVMATAAPPPAPPSWCAYSPDYTLGGIFAFRGNFQVLFCFCRFWKTIRRLATNVGNKETCNLNQNFYCLE